MSFIIRSPNDPVAMYSQDHPDESRDAMESPHLRPVTPDDHHYGLATIKNHSSDDDDSYNNDNGIYNHRKSPSIPICSNNNCHSRTSSEVREEQVALADHRDHIMYTRIYAGIAKAQQSTKDCRWRHENEMSLAHVYKARHDENQMQLEWKHKLPDKLQLNLSAAMEPQSLVGLLSQASNYCLEAGAAVEDDDNDEEELFRLDL